ncbi:hypothetical protein [Streptomyces sp. WZ.A104]|nr:hypothetical protein [Streptomyces sp. WZ.A104]
MSDETKEMKISLTVEQWEKLKAAAQSQDMTLEEFITGLLTNFVSTYTK